MGDAAVTIVGTYSSIVSEAAQNSEGGYSTTANPDTQREYTLAPPALQCSSTKGRQCHRLGELISSEGQVGLGPEAASKQIEIIAGTCTGSTLETAQTCLKPTQAVSTCTTSYPLLLYSPL